MITTQSETLIASSEKGEKWEITTPQQLYQQEMNIIWDKVNQLPEGQIKVVLAQIWEFDKTHASPTPKDFPALAVHGFIVEQLVEGQIMWKPFSPFLKDFWHIGIQVSNAYGFSLRPDQAFQANLQALSVC